MFDSVLITPLSFLVKSNTVLGDSLLQNCSQVATFIYLFIYILDLGIFHLYYISRTRNMYININVNNNDCDNNNNDNNINKDNTLHRHFPKDSCYKSEDSRSPEYYHVLEQHFFSLYNTIYIASMECFVANIYLFLAEKSLKLSLCWHKITNSRT